jgi:hypothetical protein
MAIVYQHIRKDTNEVFYVGIGKKEKRAYSKDGRNKHWKNIVNKVGYYAEIIYNDLEWNLACNMEKYLIESYGRLDLGTGLLCNKTDGGDGAIGIIVSYEVREKMRIFQTGQKRSNELKQKLSASLKGRIPWNKGKKMKAVSEETKEKMRKINLGKKHTEESKIKMSLNNSKPNSKKVINITTGEIYNNGKDCWNLNKECLKIQYSTFKGKMNGDKKNNTDYMYLEDYNKLNNK